MKERNIYGVAAKTKNYWQLMIAEGKLASARCVTSGGLEVSQAHAIPAVVFLSFEFLFQFHISLPTSMLLAVRIKE